MADSLDIPIKLISTIEFLNSEFLVLFEGVFGGYTGRSNF